MTRAYLRLDPGFADRKRQYPDGPYRALIDVFCAAEDEPHRGTFRSMAVLRAVIGRSARHLPYLFGQHDLKLLADGRVEVVGWDEWQEGDWKVAERVHAVKAARAERHGETAPEMPSPSAVRTANWRQRNRIFERDAYTCRYCGRNDYERDWLVLEHVVPSGPSIDENLVTACRPCNKRKGPRTPEEAGMVLLPVTGNGDASPTNLRDASPESVVDVTLSEPLAVSRKPLAVSRDNGAHVDDDSEYNQVVHWLASRRAWVDSPKIQTDLARIVDKKGAAAVIATMLSLTGAEDVGQFVYGARNALFPIASAKPAPQGESGEAANDRFDRGVERTRREMARMRGDA